MSLKNPVTPPGIDPGTVRLVAQRLNHTCRTKGIFLYDYYGKTAVDLDPLPVRRDRLTMVEPGFV
jgi:hypothetical protein